MIGMLKHQKIYLSFANKESIYNDGIESNGEALISCYRPAFPNSFGKYNM